MPTIEPIDPRAPALSGRVVASQSWTDVAFLHWRVESADVAPLLPAGTRPDEFDGSSWVGLIAFELADATLFGSPPVPYFGRFTEINVRLYAVDQSGRRGVVFVSLEAARLAAVLGARAAFSLPYYWATTGIERDGGAYTYRSRRRAASSLITVTPTTVGLTDDPLAEFLTARWALFADRRGRTRLLPNSHEPWVLYETRLDELHDGLIAAAGFGNLARTEPESVLWSPGVTSRFARTR